MLAVCFVSVLLDESESAILERVFGAGKETWSPAVAEAILQIRFPDADLQRMRALLEKVQAGSLDPEEEKTLGDYERVGRMMEIMKSRARRTLARPVG